MNALLLTASATELQALLQSGDLTSVQLVKACLNQIAKYDRSGPTLRAIVSTSPEERILSVAERLDKERAAGKVRVRCTASQSSSRWDTCVSPVQSRTNLDTN